MLFGCNPLVRITRRVIQVGVSAWAMIVLQFPCGGEARCQTLPLTFSAVPLYDTFWTYSDVRFEFRARNLTDSSLIHNIPWFACNYVLFQPVYEIDAEPVRMRASECCATHLGDTLLPGDSSVGFESISYRGATHLDTSYDLGWFSPGNYTVELCWNYDPLDRRYVSGRKWLCDTVTFVVQAPSGDDSLAMERYLDIRSLYKRAVSGDSSAMRQYLVECDSLTRWFPGSQFARMAARDFVTHLGWMTNLSGGRNGQIRRSQIQYIMEYPNEPQACGFVRGISRHGHDPTGRDFLMEVCRKVPDSHAGRLAAKLLVKPESY